MLIRVQYADTSYGLVERTKLDPLIATNSIVSFKRSSGWVRIGIDPVRTARGERRRNEACLPPQRELPDTSICRTYLSFDDLWLCLAGSATDCPYKQKHLSERFCTYQNAERYRVQYLPVKAQ